MLFGKKKNKTESMLASLKSEQAKSDIILATIDDGVMLIDEAGIIQLFNPAAQKITGWSSKDAMGLDHRSVLKFFDDKNQEYPIDRNPITKAFREKSTTRDNDSYILTRNNKQVPVAVNVSPLMTESNQLAGAVAVFRDVSTERQEEKQSAEFISTASHEMRTPVAAIEGYLALALNPKVSQIDSKARDYLEKAHQSTVHLGSLFQDLLTAAKSEDGRLSNHPVVIEMGQFLQEIANDVRFTAEKKGIKLDYVIGGLSNSVSTSTDSQKVIRPLYYIHADPERIREVVTNLFDNAVKYSDQGRITIGLTGSNEIVQFRISDTGQGIPAEDVPHLFQKFYRVDNSATRVIGGTGLGLFICRKIVELYNGRIWVDSTLGEGSTFYINIPRLSSDEAVRLRQTEQANASPLTDSNLQSPGVIQ